MAEIRGAGFPDVWNNFNDIIRAPKDLLGILGDLFTDLWDAIRQGVGGFVRWSYNRVQDLVYWVWNYAETFPGQVWQGIRGGFSWLGSALDFWFNRVSGWIGETGFWMWTKAQVFPGLAWGGISGGFGWIGSTLESWFTTAGGWISDAAQWTWGQAELFPGQTWRGIAGGFGWIGSALDSWFNTAGGWISDAAQWTWDQAELAPGRAWRGLKGGFNWLWDEGFTPTLELLGQVPGAILGGAETIGDWILKGFQWFAGEVFDPFIGLLDRKLSIPVRMFRGEFPSFGGFLDELMDPPPEALKHVVLIPLLLIMGIVSLIVGFMPALQPYNTRWQQETMMAASPRLLTTGDLMEARLRDIPVSSGYDEHLQRVGYRDEDINALYLLAHKLPSATDLIRMGVREAFTPEIANRFGQYQDFPADFGKWMGKLGFDLDWSERYWASHWDLPSATQGFEMLHRGIIDQADLSLLLRALDVMPYWREKLTQISYNPLTRVDVRRMYQDGVIDASKVEQTYRAQGYSPEDAAHLREWVIKAYPPKDSITKQRQKDLSESAIKQAYARRIVTRDDATERLVDLGYNEDEADFVMSIWDFDFYADPSQRSALNPQELSRSVIERAYERRLVDKNAAAAQLEELGFTPEDAALLLELVDLRLNEQLVDLEIDVVLNDYQAGAISDAQMAGTLDDMNIPRARIDFLLQREILKRQAKTARLTQGQLATAFRRGVIDQGEYADRLDAMGYSGRDVEILLALAGPA